MAMLSAQADYFFRYGALLRKPLRVATEGSPIDMLNIEPVARAAGVEAFDRFVLSTKEDNPQTRRMVMVLYILCRHSLSHLLLSQLHQASGMGKTKLCYDLAHRRFVIIIRCLESLPISHIDQLPSKTFADLVRAYWRVQLWLFAHIEFYLQYRAHFPESTGFHRPVDFMRAMNAHEHSHIETLDERLVLQYGDDPIAFEAYRRDLYLRVAVDRELFAIVLDEATTLSGMCAGFVPYTDYSMLPKEVVVAESNAGKHGHIPEGRRRVADLLYAVVSAAEALQWNVGTTAILASTHFSGIGLIPKDLNRGNATRGHVEFAQPYSKLPLIQCSDAGEFLCTYFSVDRQRVEEILGDTCWLGGKNSIFPMRPAHFFEEIASVCRDAQ